MKFELGDELCDSPFIGKTGKGAVVRWVVRAIRFAFVRGISAFWATLW